MKTILHIDDDPDHRLIVDMVFAEWGLDVELVQADSAAAGEAELEKILASGEPAMILTDHMMPGERGAPFAIRWLERCRAKGVPIWLLTSYAGNPEVVEAQERGVAGVIDKPLDLDAFELVLGAVVKPWVRGEHISA